jgi:hypothetical protein
MMKTEKQEVEALTEAYHQFNGSSLPTPLVKHIWDAAREFFRDECEDRLTDQAYDVIDNDQGL